MTKVLRWHSFTDYDVMMDFIARNPTIKVIETLEPDEKNNDYMLFFWTDFLQGKPNNSYNMIDRTK